MGTKSQKTKHVVQFRLGQDSMQATVPGTVGFGSDGGDILVEAGLFPAWTGIS